MIAHPVEILLESGQALPAEFILWDEAPGAPDKVRLDLCFEGDVVSATANDYFEALARIRSVLHGRKMLPKCYGASRDVYPSQMALQMGTGELAYRTRIGRQARMSDLVSIFASDDSVVPVSLEAQEEFHEAWVSSLGLEVVAPGRAEQVFPPQLLPRVHDRPFRWVFEIAGDLRPGDTIPPESIIGGWRMDRGGSILGPFLPNPDYEPGPPSE